ncbi:WavE lipopolysaccharide synthesis family protein [Psychromonas sp.]|uniref:WavE lipopolysaccharide synthesis family protein n=1 Tax=Psychromonas sp. TaxID=1884585 RepID=UPI0035682040
MQNIIKDSEITFVVQGPVQSGKGRDQIESITTLCLNSIRRYFPQSKIIIATWKGQVTDGLDYDLLLELDDPGSNDISVNGEIITLNNNRQLHSTHQGLKKVTTKYAVKLRSDNLLKGREFVSVFEKYSESPREDKFSFLQSRIVTSSTFFIQSHYGAPVYFHKSDLFDFGLTEDLLMVWPDKMIPHLLFNPTPGYKSRYPATEQFLCLNWLSSLVNKELFIENKSNDDAGLGCDFWNRFLANNIIADSPENLGLDVTSRFYNRGNLALEYDIKDWKKFSGISKTQLDPKRLKRSYKMLVGKLLRNTLGLFSR